MSQNVTLEDCESAIHIVTEHFWRVVESKGNCAFTSSHEVLGCVMEEFAELTSAVRIGEADQIDDELKDLAVACLFGLISRPYMDW